MPMIFKMKFVTYISIACLCYANQASGQTGQKIIIKKNDTLSNLLWNLEITPLYGKKGKILKIINLNPYLKKRSKGGHLVRPGDVINLGEYVTIESTNNFEIAQVNSEIQKTRTISSENTLSESPEKEYALGLTQTFHAYEVIEKNGEKGTIASGLTPGIFLEANFLDSSRSKLKFKLAYQYLSLLKAKDYELKDKNFLMTSLGADYSYRITPNSFLNFAVNSHEHLFFAKGNSPRIEVYKTSLRSFQFGFSGKWEIDNRHVIQPILSYSHYLGSSNQGFSFEKGYGLEVKLRLNKSQSFFIEPFYSNYKLEGNQRSYSWDQIGIGFGKEF